MYLTPYQKKQLTTVLVLVIGIPLTIFGIYKAVQWFTRAGTNTQPKNIVVSNLTTSSATITWVTEDKQTGAVVPILNSEEKGTVTDKRGTSRKSTHYVELTNLEPGTEYDFKIVSGSDTYTSNEGNEFAFTTANISTDTPVPKPIHGKIDDGGEDMLVYVFPSDKSTYPVVTTPSSNGNWLIDLSSLRRVSDRTLYQVSDSTNLTIIVVSGVDNGGLVQGVYSNIFNSSGELTEGLIANGQEYYGYISEEAKLVAQSQEDDNDNEQDEDIPDGDTREDDREDIPDGGTGDERDNFPDGGIGAGDEDDTTDSFDREYELRSDLEWIDMVSANELASNTPTNYGSDTVRVTNLTDTSFTVLWFSENEEIGYVMYGVDSDNLSDKGRDERDGISSQGEYYLHSVEITQLEPETKYYFEVYTADEVYDEVYEITTYATQSSPPEFETIAGVVNANDYENLSVIATFTDEDGIGSSGSSNSLSTLVDSEGSWILTIGGARDQDGQYFDKSSSDKVTFAPMTFSDTDNVEMTIGEATSNEVELKVSDNRITYVKIPLLEDYGILMD
jgi:hypothetical protein